MLLKANNISVHYGKARALKDVSININQGEIVTIIGSNGAGKTTILKAISGLVRLSSGEIWFDNHRIDKGHPEERASIGISYAMEGRRLFPAMTVLENLEMGAYHRKDKDGVSLDMEKIYEEFPILAERQKQKAGTLSGGQQQMLTIGRALMSRPKLLLLDEPSLGLAPRIIMDVAKIAKDLNKAGLTILIVEQNAHMALGLADRGYVLQVGDIILEGNAKSLEANPFVKRAYLGI